MLDAFGTKWVGWIPAEKEAEFLDDAAAVVRAAFAAGRLEGAREAAGEILKAADTWDAGNWRNRALLFEDACHRARALTPEKPEGG